MMQGRPFPEMKWKVFCVIQLIHLNCVNMQSFVPVLSCPETKDEWTQRSNAKNCQGSTPDYLCASIQNNPGSFGEICTVLGLANPRTCAVLSKSTYNMDFVSCRVASGCPATHYTPSELYNYPVCFKNFYGATTQSSITTQGTAEVTLMREAPKPDNERSGTNVGIVFAIVLILLIAIGLATVFVLYRKRVLPTQMEMFLTERIEGSRFLHWFRNDTRRNCSLAERSREEGETMILNKPEQPVHIEHEQEKQLLMLQRYLTHILKTKLKVTELQENIILCSKSLKEHFNEYLIKDLKNVNTEDDYDNLDQNLVFALLANFCAGIEPPGKSWGYEPPNDDNSEGADIERIRSMWNKYCDNDHHYPQLEEVYRRMINRYGEIHERILSEDDTFEDVRTKYQVLILKEDCTVKGEVVVTENIKTALQSLETSDIVICKGAIGCGKTTAMRYIKKQFKEKQWRTIWMEEFVDDSDLRENDIENTLLCCDNLFGTFSCNLFPSNSDNLFGKINCNVHSSESPRAFQYNIERKRKIYGKHLKIVLGIHNHVYDMVIKKYALELFQNQTRIIDMDNYTQAELLLVWKEEQKTGHCVHDSNCWFKNVNFSSVSAKLSLNSQGRVGNPLLLLMYCQHHYFFSNDEFTKSPVSALVEHFKKMREECSELFYVLVYIMYVTVYDKDHDLEDWAGSVNASLTTENFKTMVEKFPEYFYEDEKTIELKHELLNITLFKVAVEIPEVQSSLVSWCGLHIILQLARREEKCENEFISHFSLFDDRKSRERELGERLLKRITETDGKQLKKRRIKRTFKKVINRFGKSMKK